MKFHKDLIGLIFIIIIVIMIGVPQAVSASDKAIIRNVVDGDTLKAFYEGQKENLSDESGSTHRRAGKTKKHIKTLADPVKMSRK
jgi:hypothetical protein